MKETSGSSQASPRSFGSRLGKSMSPFKFFAAVDVDRGVTVVIAQGDGQGHGCFGRRQHDDKQGDQLPVQPQGRLTLGAEEGG